jgi:hypothetical protein
MDHVRQVVKTLLNATTSLTDAQHLSAPVLSLQAPTLNKLQ